MSNVTFIAYTCANTYFCENKTVQQHKFTRTNKGFLSKLCAKLCQGEADDAFIPHINGGLGVAFNRGGSLQGGCILHCWKNNEVQYQTTLSKSWQIKAIGQMIFFFMSLYCF